MERYSVLFKKLTGALIQPNSFTDFSAAISTEIQTIQRAAVDNNPASACWINLSDLIGLL